MKRPVGWSYFLPLGNVIEVVDAIVRYVRDATCREDRDERSLNVCNDEGWGMIFYNECDASSDGGCLRSVHPINYHQLRHHRVHVCGVHSIMTIPLHIQLITLQLAPNLSSYSLSSCPSSSQESIEARMRGDTNDISNPTMRGDVGYSPLGNFLGLWQPTDRSYLILHLGCFWAILRGKGDTAIKSEGVRLE